MLQLCKLPLLSPWWIGHIWICDYASIFLRRSIDKFFRCCLCYGRRWWWPSFQGLCRPSTSLRSWRRRFLPIASPLASSPTDFPSSPSRFCFSIISALYPTGELSFFCVSTPLPLVFTTFGFERASQPFCLFRLSPESTFFFFLIIAASTTLGLCSRRTLWWLQIHPLNSIRWIVFYFESTVLWRQ